MTSITFLCDLMNRFEHSGIKNAILIMDNVAFHKSNDWLSC